MREMSTAARVESIFREMDEDQSGELSKEEFINGARKDTSVIAALSLYSRNYSKLNEAFTSCWNIYSNKYIEYYKSNKLEGTEVNRRPS